MTKKSLKVAVQMDPMENVNIDGDSTFVLMLEAQARGYELYHYGPSDITYDEGRVTAFAHPVTVRREKGNHFTFGEAEQVNLKDMDVILMRQDPPFDMAYITATHLLELIMDDVLIVNDPVEVRNAPEKLFATQFVDLMPPTMITRRLADITAFRQRYGDIIIKPLHGNGGAGVFYLKPGDSNLGTLHEMFMDMNLEPVMVQKFLPEVVQGDKRIILIDGEIGGIINRIPAKGEIRSNLVAGGLAEDIMLSDRDREICARLKEPLKERGLLFVGIDVIGNWLTEINVTSPTGLQSINRLADVCLEADIWDAIERKLA